MAEEGKDFYSELISRGVIAGGEQESQEYEEETQEQKVEEQPEEQPEEPLEQKQEQGEQGNSHEEVVEQKQESEPEEELYEPEFTDDVSKEFYASLKEGNYERVAEIVNEAVGWKNLKDEDLAFSYLQELNPDFSEDDLNFSMAEEFGIGLTELTEDQREEMTAKEIADYEKQVKSQKIAYKKFLREAKQHYEARAKEFKLEFPEYKRQVVKEELPEEYRQYLEQKQTVEQASKQWKETVDKVLSDYKGELSESIEIVIDDSKVAYDSKFVLTDNDKKALQDELLTRVATPREVSMFTKENGEVDVKGYVDYVAGNLFQKQILAAAVKEALTKDREQFIEGMQKNSSFRQLSATAKPVQRQESWERQLMSYGLPN